MLDKQRRRHPTRGTKRGRPRGSRRGGGTGSAGRPENYLTNPPTNSDPRLNQSGTTPSSSTNDAGTSGVAVTSSLTSSTNLVASPFRQGVTPRRGPGRPRLRPTGPANQGHRQIIRARRPFGPLVVPLGSNPGTPSSSNARSPVIVTSSANQSSGSSNPWANANVDAATDADEQIKIESSPI